METNLNTGRRLTLIAAALSASFATQVWGNDLPSMGDEDSPWQVNTTYENHTVGRERIGLAKFRNTLQSELDKKVGNGWAIHSTLRGSWDGVYRLNSSEYGKDAGGSIQLEDMLGNGSVAHGAGWGAASYPVPAPPGLASGYPNNPNSGLRVLGDRWNSPEGGVTFGVPVRPCDVDSRGCRDFGGYGNQSLQELESPEFNKRWDFVRELYAKNTFSLGGGQNLFVKVGKQQVVWGRTDLFRVLDVINPVDYSRNNIYDELSDIRIPMWIAQAEYRMGASDSMQDRNFQIVWNFDQFRASNLGQCGSPNVMLDAGCLFRGLANLWDNGGTASNFGAAAAGLGFATNFGPHQIGIRNVNLPAWSLANTQIGAKYEGVTASGLSFSVNALHYRSQLPSLHAFNYSPELVNPATGVPGAEKAQKLIAFDMHFPRLNMLGGSLDFQIPEAGAAVRMEGAMTWGEEFANTMRDELYSKHRVFRSVIGIDRPTFIPFISESAATLISAQLFYQHIFGYESEERPLGRIGMIDWKDNFIGTLLIRGSLRNGTLSPQLVFAHDFSAQASAIAPQIEWNYSNDLKFTIGANYKLAEGRDRWKADDCRGCASYPQFAIPGQAPGYNLGMSGMEPLGRFRAGPIGTAWKENDIFLRVNYKF